MKLEDLPPNLRAQVDAKLGTSKRKRTTQVAIKGEFRGSCHACGEQFDTNASWERHADERFPGHGRLDQIGGAA